jgi:hypothetical protein
VPTPQGPGRFFVDLAERASSILVLGHGAGGVGAADLELLARSLPCAGYDCRADLAAPGRTAGRTVGSATRDWTKPGLPR